jgi:hypothetical protein
MTSDTIERNTFKEFDRNRLSLSSLSERKSDLCLDHILPLSMPESVDPAFSAVAERIFSARARGASVILMMGGHVIRAGVQRFLIDLMEKGFISLIATNGSGAIHDFEFSLAGETTESVPLYIKDGRFGLWNETGRINDIVAVGAAKGMGLGEAVGKEILEKNYPNRDVSVFAAGYRLGIPVTVHVGIGYDIIHPYPNFDGGAYGETSYRDFLRFAHVLENIEGGAVMNFGSSVMAPEVYLKALSMVRNVARKEGRTVSRFTTLVCDLQDLPSDFSKEADKGSPGYYFRPWKTMLVRTVADGGESFYKRMDHKRSVPSLWAALCKEEERNHVR